MVQGHHLQHRSHPSFFCNFKWVSIKLTVAHHPNFWNEVDELLAKEVIETFSASAGFYSSVFVVPMCTGGLWPIINLKQFNCYLHNTCFKMPNIRHVQHLIQCDYVFSFDLKDAYLHIPIVKHHYHHFL